MTPNNPMTEGEALDAAIEAWDDVYDGVSHNKREAMRAALTAHTASSGGEVACHRWWRNGELVDSDWTNGPPSERQIEAQRQCRDIADWTVEYAYRAPPAAVPADALERLAASMESAWRPNCCCSDTAKSCADELAALIPKGADHEQR